MLYETALLWFYFFIERRNNVHNKSVKEVVFSGLFITLGLVLPVVFHFFGLGKTFLPMHIPVLLAGFMLSVPYAAAVGALTPLLSSVITGMPPLFPIMPYMVLELAVYAAVASILSRKLRLNIYISLILSMIAGRVAAGIAVWFLVIFFEAKLPGPFAFIASAVTTGIPGIIIQIAFIPPMAALLRKSRIFKNGALEIEQ
jgi:uncharacterized membrane protein